MTDHNNSNEEKGNVSFKSKKASCEPSAFKAG